MSNTDIVFEEMQFNSLFGTGTGIADSLQGKEKLLNRDMHQQILQPQMSSLSSSSLPIHLSSEHFPPSLPSMLSSPELLASNTASPLQQKQIFQVPPTLAYEVKKEYQGIEQTITPVTAPVPPVPPVPSQPCPVVLKNMRTKLTQPHKEGEPLYGVQKVRKGGRPKGSTSGNSRSTEDSKKHRQMLNRRNAAKSRLRKKYNFEEALIKMACLQMENHKLRKKVLKKRKAESQLQPGSSSPSLLSPPSLSTEAKSLFDVCKKRQISFGTEALVAHSAFDLTKAMNSDSVCFVMTDATQDNPIQFASPNFYSLTGYSPAEVIGRNPRFLQGEFTNKDTLQAIRTAISSRTPVLTKILNYKKDGTPIWLHLHIAPLGENNWVSILKPIELKFLYSSSKSKNPSRVVATPVSVPTSSIAVPDSVQATDKTSYASVGSPSFPIQSLLSSSSVGSSSSLSPTPSLSLGGSSYQNDLGLMDMGQIDMGDPAYQGSGVQDALNDMPLDDYLNDLLDHPSFDFFST